MRDGTTVNQTKSATKEILHFVHPALRFGVVQLRIAFADFLELIEQFALPIGKSYRCFDHDVAMQVARADRAYAFDTFAAQAKDFSGLRLTRNFQPCAAIQSGDFNFAAKRRSADADWHFAMQIIVIALENAMRFEMHLNIQIAAGTAIHASFALTGNAYAIAFVNSRWNFDRVSLVLLDASGALATSARVGDVFAGAVAFGDRKSTRLNSSHLARSRMPSSA